MYAMFMLFTLSASIKCNTILLAIKCAEHSSALYSIYTIKISQYLTWVGNFVVNQCKTLVNAGQKCCISEAEFEEKHGVWESMMELTQTHLILEFDSEASFIDI
jgi:hypothetical protein